MKPGKIHKLNETVVNRIAAGEIIQRPVNALKELLENAIDAGSTSIQVLVKEGGLKLLQIQDNGHGIRKEDLTIVCERFTTSKLSTFDDLRNISTFGFRGEALASISHVARVTITTKTHDSQCAWRAHYSDGKLTSPKFGMSSDPKPCAGNQGTQITVEDLFYNISTRKGAFKNFTEEYNRILEVIQRYSIQYPNVAFSCKKFGEISPDHITKVNSSSLDNIRLAFSAAISKELLPLEFGSPRYDYTANGFISNPNYHLKKIIILLFINHRLVECSALKKSIEACYTEYLPRGTSPFVYLSISLNPQNLDVNIHPTKREVLFLNQSEIISHLVVSMKEALDNANQSRAFSTQMLLPGALPPVEHINSCPSLSKTPDHKLVRTDSREKTLDIYVKSAFAPLSNPKESISASIGLESQIQLPTKDSNPLDEVEPTLTPRKFVEVRLTSILELQQEVLSRSDPELVKIVQTHTFVGCVDETLALIQYDTQLLLVNFEDLCFELFYILGLKGFSNFGLIQLDSPIIIFDAIMSALEPENLDEFGSNMMKKDDIAKTITALLISRRDMLGEYFSINISKDGQLLSVPLMLKGYIPSPNEIPLFLLRLGTEIKWNSEKECFAAILEELSLLFASQWPSPIDTITQETIKENSDCSSPDIGNCAEADKKNSSNLLQSQNITDKKEFTVEHVLFPAIKKFLLPSQKLKSAFKCVAGLSELYKVFERC